MYIQKPEGPYGRDDTQENRMFKEGFKQTSFYGTGMMKNQEKVSSHNMLFRTGKSVVFSMERMELGQYIQTLPLYVFLFILTASPTDMTYGGSMADPNMGRGNWKPVLIGSVSIPLNELKVSDEIDAPKGERIPQKRTISGTFTIKNDRGYDVGVIDMDVRLRSLVKAGPIDNFNEYLTQNFSKSFSLQRPMTDGGPHSGTMDKSLRMQTGAVTRNPLFTVTDNTFQNQPVQNTYNPMLGTMANGEMGALSTLVQHYKDTQAQTIMMRGQIENQINTMANQLADISRQLKGEPQRFVEERQTKKKVKKKSITSSGKVLNTQPIKRPSSANPSRPSSLSNSTKTVDSLSMRKKNVTLGRNTNSYLEQPTKDWYHVLHGTSTVRKPQSASSSTKSSVSKKKTVTPSSATSSMKTSKKVDKSVRLEEELARHVLENLHQQQEDDEREGTTMSGLIPQLADTLKLLARKSQKQEEEPEEMITIPSELYKTIKENNDRYNNLQRSYQAIMEEFVDNPNKLFSSMTRVDTRGMSFREKELWKNQNKLITLLRDNYNQIKKENGMQALKDVKSSQKRSPIIESSVKKPSPRKVEEVEESTDSSSSSSSEEEKKKKKDKKDKKDKKEKKKEKKEKEINTKPVIEVEETQEEEEDQGYQFSQFHGDHDPTPVIEVEETQEEEESNGYAPNQPQSAEDFLKQYDEGNENQNYEPQHDTSQMFQTQANQNPIEIMTATDAYLPLSASLGVSEIKTTGETETSFGDFEEFDNSHFDTSEAPQSDTLRTEDFSVVHVSQDNTDNNNNYYDDQQQEEYQPQQQVVQEVEEEEFEDFDNDFEEQHDENQDPEDETYEEQQEGHQEQEVVDSVDYSGIEDRTEEERI
ncbi:predicted protein [Naegleria gruberi]|uniref:Predicted protein n=1 Tax=Naegleria gruberi TaxID=5762 RepID=D2VJ78_NAEGR|nr:uncharacterized protein NAEGRDRAFT_68940 [Naegleria gruberi]EFC43232.1 predicted protein [Naegleria gruberi]|eukprot:XP_002675976.1 predicted protein [Naegleria gruberi strain NEG-M]